jgi:hypothetical protein
MQWLANNLLFPHSLCHLHNQLLQQPQPQQKQQQQALLCSTLQP